LPSSTRCRGGRCHEEELDNNSVSPEALLHDQPAAPPDYDRSLLLPVANQPEPETVGGEKPTADTDEMLGSEAEYPAAQKTEFVVHVEQQDGSVNPEPAASPASQAHHHPHPHHQPAAESEPAPSSSSSNGSGGSGRRHHRLQCWGYEKRQRQCLNGGQCFAIQLHNGIRRSGCR